MEEMTEAELESHVLSKNGNAEARYVLGRMMIEGTSDKIPKNENKGLNWLKESVKQGHIDALEYKTYWDIRFDRTPKLDKIIDSLEKVIAANNSARACNTLAELNHASASGVTAQMTKEHQEAAAEKAKQAAKYYLTSAEQGDIIGTHWLGVFYHEGFGVTKNIDKAIEHLTKSAAAGNGQSMYQLFLIHSGKEGQDASKKNPEVAYTNLMNAICNGVTYFDEAVQFFNDNYDVLAPVYVKSKGLPVEVKKETENDIKNMHQAYISELKVNFSTALGKDRMYHRPCGFINDQQIWMVGVQIQYFINTVLRFSHKDFIKAVKTDLGPILGDLGLWSLKCQQDQAKEKKDNELKKKIQICMDIVEKYLENGLDTLGDEKKYNFMNKFGPKKCPDQQIKRESLKHMYSW